MKEDISKLKALGQSGVGYNQPSMEILEWFENSFTGNSYTITHITKEITSLCRKTGQPDFGIITIEYEPNKKLVESKSLKLYLQSYRNERTFMEPLINRIANDIFKVIKPKWLRITGEFNARGGVELKTQVYKQ